MKQLLRDFGGFCLRYGPVIFRAFLYASIEALPVLVAGFYRFAKAEEPATGWFLVALFANATYHVCVGLRAYFDGSASRYLTEISDNKTIPSHM